MNEQEWFSQIKKFPQVAIETVIWRRKKLPHFAKASRDDPKGIEVLLIKRPPDDPYYASLWHVPGTILRNRETFKQAFFRLEREELGTKFKSPPEFVYFKESPREPRCHHLSMVHLAQLKGSPKAGRFWLAHHLPKKLVQYHARMIQKALKAID